MGKEKKRILVSHDVFKGRDETMPLGAFLQQLRIREGKNDGDLALEIDAQGNQSGEREHIAASESASMRCCRTNRFSPPIVVVARPFCFSVSLFPHLKRAEPEASMRVARAVSCVRIVGEIDGKRA